MPTIEIFVIASAIIALVLFGFFYVKSKKKEEQHDFSFNESKFTPPPFKSFEENETSLDVIVADNTTVTDLNVGSIDAIKEYIVSEKNVAEQVVEISNVEQKTAATVVTKKKPSKKKPPTKKSSKKST